MSLEDVRSVQTTVRLNFIRESYLESIIGSLTTCKNSLVDLGLTTSAEILEDVILNLARTTSPDEESSGGSSVEESSGDSSGEEVVRFRCVKEGRRLRVKIISGSYNRQANCWFPKTNGFRVEGREYEVPRWAVTFNRGSRGTPYYIIYAGEDNSNITILSSEGGGEGSSTSRVDAVYGDDEPECGVCMDADKEVVFAPCGHFFCCTACGNEVSECPLCRSQIEERIPRGEC